jgi:hypothetical protein
MRKLMRASVKTLAGLVGIGLSVLVGCGGSGGENAESGSGALSATSVAPVTREVIDCKTATPIDGAIQEVKFSIAATPSGPKPPTAVLNPDGNADDRAPIKVTPQGRVTLLNENVVVSSTSTMMRISGFDGDSNGSKFVDLVLMGELYGRGYLRISTDQPGGDAFATLICTVTFL